tara:strand:- start:1284 stop:2003 length:720 start_codon:yes stop_codon:yes gene_type:complete
MMPKAKSDQVITHRIELQNTEREILETAILANAASKTLAGVASAVGTAVSGLGQMIAPAMGALAAWYIADKTFDEVRELGERQKAGMEEDLAISYEGTYGSIVAWFNSRSIGQIIWDAREANVIDFTWEPKNQNKFFPEVVDDLSFSNPVHQMIFGMDMPQAGDPRIPNWFAAVIANFIRVLMETPETNFAGKTPGELFAEFYSLEQFGRDQYYYIQRTTTQAMGVYGTGWSWVTGWAI